MEPFGGYTPRAGYSDTIVKVWLSVPNQLHGINHASADQVRAHIWLPSQTQLAAFECSAWGHGMAAPCPLPKRATFQEAL